MKYYFLSLFVLLSFNLSQASEPGSIFQLGSQESHPNKISLKYYDQMSEPLDILFVIDNSGSMSSHQQNLAKNIDGLTQKLMNGIDFHISFISTDVDKDPGHFLGSPLVITSKDLNAEEAIKRNVMLGTDGSPDEKPLDALSLALSDEALNTYNTGFLRQNAKLIVIMMTDAGGTDQISRDQLMTQLSALKGNNFNINGFIVPPGDLTCLRDPDGDAENLVELITKSGGQAANLCSADFSTDLIRIIGAKDGFGRKLPLPYLPNIDSLRVIFNGQDIPRGVLRTGWFYDPSQMAVVIGDEVDLSGISELKPLTVEFSPAHN